MKRLYFILPCFLLLFSGCKKTETVETVTSADFIDSGLYGYLQANYDTNGDYIFQPEEIAAVKNLDLTKEDYIYNLKGLEKFTSLRGLDIDGLKLQTKNLKISNKKLRRLNCGLIGLNNLDVSECVELEYLNCRENNLTTLNLEENTNLERLYCLNTSLNEILISKCVKLKFIWAEGSPLNSLDISKNIALEKLWFTVDRFWELDISNNPNLQDIDILDPLPKEGTLIIYLSQGQTIPSVGYFQSSSTKFTHEFKYK